jgi:hypothetical protein
MSDQLWIEPVGGIIIARMRGTPTEELLKECQRIVVELLQQTAKPLVLYDALEMTPPDTRVAWSQRSLDGSLDIRPRRTVSADGCKSGYP